MNNLLALQIADVAFHEFLCVGVLVESGKKLAPLLLAHRHVNLRNHGTVVHIVERRLPVHFIGVVALSIRISCFPVFRLLRIHEQRFLPALREQHRNGKENNCKKTFHRPMISFKICSVVFHTRPSSSGVS